jgi:hypothetical protein
MCCHKAKDSKSVYESVRDVKTCIAEGIDRHLLSKRQPVTHFMREQGRVGNISAQEDKVSPRKLVDGKELSSNGRTSETTRITNAAVVDEDIGSRSTTNSHLAHDIVGEAGVVDIADCPRIVFLTSGSLEHEKEWCIGPSLIKLSNSILILSSVQSLAALLVPATLPRT